MTEPMLTLRTMANTWECDGNGHLNIQFYFGNFDDAGRVFAAAGWAPTDPLISRHIRFHAELHAEQDIIIRSKAVPAGVVHHMYTDDGARLSATAIDLHGAPTTFGIDDEAAPRGLDIAPPEAADLTALLATGEAVIANIAVVRPEQCDPQRGMTDRHIVSCISNAAAAAWALAGFDIAFRRQNGLGTVAVEMKVTAHERPSPGDILEIISSPRAATSKIVRMHHCVRNRSTGRVAVTGDIVALLMDLKKRRTVSLPQDRLAPWLRS
ncbi:MAG: thioesterase family protein [Rhodobiaceae bacterium]|nr:thioesterase family protein [Rhodobiaceae bacterium]MCC0055069.1 thioesterase family protein [Rhodobiaceae bacterium]